MKNTADLIVVGGGPAGLMAAGTAGGRGLRVILIEKNEKVGRKLGITGKGRCNLTNNTTPQKVVEALPTNGKFMYSALNLLTPADTMALFEGLGVPLKTERGGRVFPVSDRAADVVNALRTYCRRGNVETVTATVKDVITEDGRVTGVTTDKGDFYAPTVCIATGGASYPATGSTGDGYRLAEKLGHTVVQPRGSLVPLESPDGYCAKMQGFALKNVGLTVLNKSGKKVYEDFGEMLFTHFGVSGPMILSASAHMRNFDKDQYRLSIDLKPALDESKLDARILRDFQKYANREFINSLGELAGRSMIPVLVELSGIPPETRVNSITKAQRRKLLELFKAFPVRISGPRPVEEAIVTTGGVNVREMDPKTLESKKVPGLRFAGEVIDVDGYTGGYNLQIAWSTGYAVGMTV